MWSGIILDQIAPVRRGNIEKSQGFSYHDEVQFKGKSKFLQSFYEGEGGRGMKDLILHDRICTELETRGYEIRAVPEAQTYTLFKRTVTGGEHGE